MNITKKSFSIQVDMAFRYVFTFSFAAVDSKTSSRVQDRKGVYTQNSKMAAQNGRMTTNFKPLFLGNQQSLSRYFVNNNITIHELHNKRNNKKKSFWTFSQLYHLKCDQRNTHSTVTCTMDKTSSGAPDEKLLAKYLKYHFLVS